MTLAVPDKGCSLISFPLRKFAFLCFILSGAASVSYQTIWLRQAMTYFGVITPVNSTVLSVFMLGLALGTFLVGRMVGRISQRRALIFYIFVEGFIAALALMVPAFFKESYLLLLYSGTGQSGTYLFYSCLSITLILLPACTLIGATFPLLIHCLKSDDRNDKSFSFLYYANLCGALIGCVMPCIFIELYGFSQSLHITAALNVLAAFIALCALSAYPRAQPAQQVSAGILPKSTLPVSVIITLFMFGFVTLGCEIVWMRTFMPVVGSTVYSFALILSIYLIATTFGTQLYRERSLNTRLYHFIIMLLPAAAVLPIFASSMVALNGLHSLAAFSIAPLCFCFGYLTPKLIDATCGNNTRSISNAYVFNCLGCIAGPVFSTYIVFPVAGIKECLAVYACLLLPVAYYILPPSKLYRIGIFAVFGPLLLLSLMSPNKEDAIRNNGILSRDHIGYIGATGQDLKKSLTVNGIGMTGLTTVTKNMAHLTMLHHMQAKSALVICFGMGTTVRSLTSWPLESITAIELSQGVIRSFGYFHADAARVLADPRVHIINDDGRRFLNRSHEQFDIILLDPPPPISAAGSGLLYTTEFLTALKSRLAPGGVVQHWIPDDRASVFINATLNSLHKKFKYVKLYSSLQGSWGRGIHILASDSPFPTLTEEQFIQNLPPKAIADLKEWLPYNSLQEIASASLHQLDENAVLKPEFKNIYMSDDRLYNEFYLLREQHWITP